MATKTFQIWETPEGSFVVEKGRPLGPLLSEEEIEDSIMLHEFEANSYVDMMQKRNDFLGFGKYHPMKDDDGNFFAEDFEEFINV